MADDLGPGEWVTIDGTHVFIKDGVVEKGPAALVGKPADHHDHIKALIAKHDADNLSNRARKDDAYRVGVNQKKYNEERFKSDPAAKEKYEANKSAQEKAALEQKQQHERKAQEDAESERKWAEVKKQQADAKVKDQADYKAKVAGEIEADKNVEPHWPTYHAVQNRLANYTEHLDAKKYADVGDVIATKRKAEELENLIADNHDHMGTMGKDIWDKFQKYKTITEAQGKALAISTAKAATKRGVKGYLNLSAESQKNPVDDAFSADAQSNTVTTMIPKPAKDETRPDFLKRTMANADTVSAFPDAKQRTAVAYSKWRDANPGDGGCEDTDPEMAMSTDDIAARAAGHGTKFGACGHKLSSCKCDHAGDPRFAQYSDSNCTACCDGMGMSADTSLSDLTTTARNDLNDSEFAIPETRSYPIPDLAHARNALARVAQHGTADEKAKVRAAVKRKFPEIDVAACEGMDDSGDDDDAATPDSAMSDAKKKIAMSTRPSCILRMDDSDDDDMEMSDSAGMPDNDDAGQPIHYRKMKVGEIGDWTHRGTGEQINLTKDRADEWVKNTNGLIAAGVKPFMPPKHDFAGLSDQIYGSVHGMSHDGKNIYCTVGLHGDDALKAAAKNGCSVGIVKDAMDAKGNTYPGESLHHLAIVPNPALPRTGGMMKIAASASAPAIEIPIYTKTRPAHVDPAKPKTQTAAGRKDSFMNPEIAQKVRRELSLSVDVTDEKLPDVVAEKAMALSADLTARTRERDAAVADSTKKTEEVMSLSAEIPKKPTDSHRAIYASNWRLMREHIIGKGILTEPQMRAGEQLFLDRDGGIGALALSASGNQDRKELLFAFGQWVLALDGSGVKFNAGTTRDPNFQVIGTASNGMTPERYREMGLEPPKSARV